MKFKEIDYREFEQYNKNYRAGKIQEKVQEFIDSGLPVVLVEYGETEYTCPASCQGTLKGAIRKMNVEGTADAITRNGKVFLVNKTRQGGAI